jgi:hypothetical protein
MRQTNPILAEEASALMMDDGLLMIWGQAMAAAEGGRSLTPMRQTKPICRVLGPKTRVCREIDPILRVGDCFAALAMTDGAIGDWGYEIRDARPPCGRCAKQTQSLYMLWCRYLGAQHIEGDGGRQENKANPRGRGPRLGIGDCRLGIRGRGARAVRVDRMSNKANPAGVFEPGKLEIRSPKLETDPESKGSNPGLGDVSAAQNKANFPRSWAKNAGAPKNKPNPEDASSKLFRVSIFGFRASRPSPERRAWRVYRVGVMAILFA